MAEASHLVWRISNRSASGIQFSFADVRRVKSILCSGRLTDPLPMIVRLCFCRRNVADGFEQNVTVEPSDGDTAFYKGSMWVLTPWN